ncbi:MAG: sigma-70 family RNA polymerase sigma factor [Planctomyces sp.]|nr:sigma-70 family RNA polymerase sigma factor [Planctomyces sp.]
MSDHSDESQASVLRPLLDRARQGDIAAQEELFAKCRNYIALVARAQVESWMRTKVDASDLVQQTLLEAYRGFQNFQGRSEGEWLAWLRQILTHNAQDFIRQLRTEKRGGGAIERSLSPGDDSGSFFAEPAADEATPSQLVSAREREIAVADAIARLSPDHQEVIILRNLQRLPFEEIAERMGRTRPAVQMLWTRAIQKLEQLLASGEDFAGADD